MTYKLETLVLPLLLMAFLAGFSLFAWLLPEYPEDGFWNPMYEFINAEYVPGPWPLLQELQMKLCSVSAALMIPLVWRFRQGI